MRERAAGLITGALRTPLLFLILLGPAVAAAEEARFDSNGTRLRYFSQGDGPPVVLLHGFGGSSEGLYIRPGTYAALADAGYRVIALDQRGHGGSDKPYDPDAYGPEMAEDVRRLLDHMNIDRVHLVGYSMGGKVASAFLSHYPERLLTITLGGYGWPWQSEALTLEEARENMASRSVLPGNDLEALAAVSVGMSRLTVSAETLQANTIPALAIIGDRDEVVPASDRDRLEETMANLVMNIIPGTHAGPDGAPYKRLFAEKLIAFLKRH